MKYSFSSLEDIWKGVESKKWKFMKIPNNCAPRENKEMFLAKGGGAIIRTIRVLKNYKINIIFWIIKFIYNFWKQLFGSWIYVNGVVAVVSKKGNNQLVMVTNYQKPFVFKRSFVFSKNVWFLKSFLVPHDGQTMWSWKTLAQRLT